MTTSAINRSLSSAGCDSSRRSRSKIPTAGILARSAAASTVKRMTSTCPTIRRVQLGKRLMARDTSPSNRMMRQERRDQVKTALAEMSPRDREILVMRYLEHLDGVDIAEALGITDGAVKVRLLRALQRMRGRLRVE